MTGGDVTGVLSVNTDGTTATVLMWQDGHLWLSGTSDGATQDYTNDGKGSSDPFLVDNDSSASAQFASVTSFTDSKCNTLHHTIVFFGKNDLSQTNSANGAVCEALSWTTAVSLPSRVAARATRCRVGGR